ncbi:receptor-like protein EIX2 [Senna tora]|uniref:Receptor-like protein EIX2 n=1 Tax=Senna tora TaxID=362788 RepID=A0A835CKA1_9FABA|nr:receptor-like protein EIX2 [Senna tora]
MEQGTMRDAVSCLSMIWDERNRRKCTEQRHDLSRIWLRAVVAAAWDEFSEVHMETGTTTINTGTCSYGGGVIGRLIRDSSGACMAAFVEPRNFPHDPMLLEALAILRGVEMARESGVRNLVIESDSKIVVDHLQIEERMPSLFSSICNSLQQLFKNSKLLKRIDLSSNGLMGMIPMELRDLVELVSLNLSRNYLRGEIPYDIGRLVSLEFLDLSRNHLHSSIPSSLARINRLSMLDLSHNRLSGESKSAHNCKVLMPRVIKKILIFVGCLLRKCAMMMRKHIKNKMNPKKMGIHFSLMDFIGVWLWDLCNILLPRYLRKRN